MFRNKPSLSLLLAGMALALITGCSAPDIRTETAWDKDSFESYDADGDSVAMESSNSSSLYERCLDRKQGYQNATESCEEFLEKIDDTPTYTYPAWRMQ